MTINDDSSIINKWSLKLIDNPRVVIYDRHMFIVQATEGEIFYACRTSMTHVSAPKSLKVVVITNIFFSSKWNIFLELRHVSLRNNKCQKFGLNEP